MVSLASGAVAQLVARLVRNEKARGSNPLSSTHRKPRPTSTYVPARAGFSHCHSPPTPFRASPRAPPEPRSTDPAPPGRLRSRGSGGIGSSSRSTPANDPRFCPTEWVVVGGPAGEVTLADLESLPARLRDDCGWGVGYEVDVSKRGGGIGASGATVLGLILGVVGTVPTVQMLFGKLRRVVPDCPEHDDALETATWAIAMQYDEVERKTLKLVAEARDPDRWTFELTLPATGDDFEVEVYGFRSGTVATRVVWSNGDPAGGRPSTRRSHRELLRQRVRVRSRQVLH